MLIITADRRGLVTTSTAMLPSACKLNLSAIEKFAHEAFRADSRLQQFRVGELTGCLVHGPSALVAAIVRGSAPEDYQAVLRDALERIHLELGGRIATFAGQAEPIEGARELLRPCLREQRRTRERPWLMPALGALVASIVVLALVLVHRASSLAQKPNTNRV